MARATHPDEPFGLLGFDGNLSGTTLSVYMHRNRGRAHPIYGKPEGFEGPLFLLCDELTHYSKKTRSSGRVGGYRSNRRAGRFSTSVHFPTHLHEKLREEEESLSKTVIRIVEAHYNQEDYR